MSEQKTVPTPDDINLSLLKAVMAGDIDSMRKALATGKVDPSKAIPYQDGDTIKIVSSYQFLMDKLFYEQPLSSRSLQRDVDILTGLLSQTCISIPLADRPWQQTKPLYSPKDTVEFASIYWARNGAKNCTAIVDGYNSIKSRAKKPLPPLVPVQHGDKLEWRTEHNRFLMSDILNQLEQLDAIEKMLPARYADLMEDEKLWESRVAAASWDDALAAYQREHYNDPTLVTTTISLNRLLEREQKNTALARYLDGDPASPSKKR